MSNTFPRMLLWGVLSVLLMCLTLWAQVAFPGNVVAVTLYKAHLLAFGGWGGYWLDRALFPYNRPHTYLTDEAIDSFDGGPEHDESYITGPQLSPNEFGTAMVRRAIIVAACLVCVGLGA